MVSESQGTYKQSQNIDNLSIVGDGNTVSLHETQIIITPSFVQNCPLNANSPYKGLRRFESRDAGYFFGREQFINSLIQGLEVNNLIILLGASGSGKSSVIRAGVIPRLAKLRGNKFFDFIFTPDKDPFDSFRSSLMTKSYKQGEIDIILKKDPHIKDANIIAQVVESLKEENSEWLIFIDQFEEVFRCENLECQANFIRNITQIAKSSDKTVQIILAMRADFIDKLSSFPEIIKATDKDKCRPIIAEMYLDELRLAIEQPAAKNGVIYESGLVDEIIKDVLNQPGSLPSLQYTLDLLWKSDNISNSNRILKIQTYRSIGGVRGALQEHIDKIYNKLNHQQQIETKKIFLRLVDIVVVSEKANLVDKVVSKRDLLSKFPDDLKLTLQKLIDKNLIVSDGKEDGESTVEIAHEALISSWRELKKWIEEAKGVIFLKNRLADDVQRWETLFKSNNPKSQNELWSGSKLDGALELIQDKSFESILGGLNENENKFINESKKLQDSLEEEKERSQREKESQLRKELDLNRKLQKRAMIAVSLGFGVFIFLVATGIASWLAINQWQSAGAKEKTNKSLQLATSSEANFNIDTARSLLLAIQANIVQETPQATYALWQAFQENHEQLQLIHNGKVIYAEFDPNNSQRVLTVSSDKTAKIWDLNTVSNSVILREHTGGVIYGSFEPRNSNRLLTVSNDGTAKIWDISNVKKPMVMSNIKHNDESISYGRISSDNPNQLLTISQTSIKLWDISNFQAPKELKSLSGKKGEVWTSISDPQNFYRVLILSNNGTGIIWDLGKNEQILTINHIGVVNGSFDPRNPKRILTVGHDRTIRIWDLDSRNNIISLSGHKKTVWQAIFDPKNSNHILTVSDDGTTRIWDINQRKELRKLTGHQGRVLYGAFNPQDSNEVLTVSSDGTAKIWDIDKSKVKFTLYGHTKPINFAVFDSKNTQRILTVSEDNTARIWDTNDKSFTSIRNQEGKASSDIMIGVFNPINQDYVLTITKDGTITNWDIYKHKELTRLSIKVGILQKVWIDLNNLNRIAIIKRDGSAEIRIGESIIPLRPKGIKVESISIDPKNANRLLTVSSTTATVWDISSNPPVIQQELQQSPIPMNQGDFDPNNSNRLATVGGDGKVSIWNLKQPNQVEKLLVISNQELWHVSFDPKDSNRILVIGSDKVVRVWNIAKDIPIAELSGHQDTVVYGSFDPKNSNRILTVSHDGTARVWDLTNPEKPLILKGNNQKLVYGSFDSQNSNRVITVSSDGIARIYNIGGKELLSLAWENSSRCLNSQEVTHYDLKKYEPLISLSSYMKKSQQELINKKQRPDCSK